MIKVPLAYLGNFWRSLEIPLTNCDVELELRWSNKCIFGFRTAAANRAVASDNLAADARFEIRRAELYVPVVILSSSDNKKLIEDMRKGMKKTVMWNRQIVKDHNMPVADREDNLLITPNIQGVNKMYLLGMVGNNFEEKRNSLSRPFFADNEIKSYNVKINGRNFYDNNITDLDQAYPDLRDIMTGKGINYTTGAMLDKKHVKDSYKIRALDLSMQEALDEDPRVNQQLDLRVMTGTADRRMITVYEEAKETVLVFEEGTVKVM